MNATSFTLSLQVVRQFTVRTIIIITRLLHPIRIVMLQLPTHPMPHVPHQPMVMMVQQHGRPILALFLPYHLQHLPLFLVLVHVLTTFHHVVV